MDAGGGLLSSLAHAVGSSEDALRLLLSIVAGYPISLVHRNYLYGKPPTLQYLFFIITGLALGLFNFGYDLIHPISAILITYAILATLGGGTLSLAIVFCYTMGHLLIGYWTTATNDYDIKWTMPQCVITLRLIGLAFNLSDGQIPEEKLSAENKAVALREVPGLIEVLAHNFYPGSFLIGPQLPLIRLRNFVTLKLKKEPDSKLPDSVRAGCLRGVLGAVYLTIYLLGSAYVTDDYILSEEFAGVSFWKRIMVVGVWGRVALYKYISCWLLAEGSCIVMGLTYNGKDEKGVELWDSCSNVKIRIFESTTRMNNYIESFNVNTNHWVAQYIYKRLKFLNNRTFSQLGVLLFLAVWHGFHSGYYTTFFYEFISIYAEKELLGTLSKYPKVASIVSLPALQPVLYPVLRVYTFVSMGYAMIPFILLKHQKYMSVFYSFYFYGHLVYFLIIGLCYAVRIVFPPTKRKEKKDH